MPIAVKEKVISYPKVEIFKEDDSIIDILPTVPHEDDVLAEAVDLPLIVNLPEFDLESLRYSLPAWDE